MHSPQMQQHHDKLNGRRTFNQQAHNRNLDHTIKSLQDQIQLTIYNYENILQTQKKNSSERSQFLLYLIQSLRTRHMEQLQALSSQIQEAQAEKQSVQSMQKQMENIGEGLDQIMEQSHKLKAQNQNLLKQLQDQQNKQKQIDQQIQSAQRQIQQCKLKIDDWERLKIKWNRHKKQMIQMIEGAQKLAQQKYLKSQQDQNQIQCMQTGQDTKNCQHCQKNIIQQLKIKYNQKYRKST